MPRLPVRMIAILVIAVTVTAMAAYGIQQLYATTFRATSLVQYTGRLIRVQSFNNNGKFKWLWHIQLDKPGTVVTAGINTLPKLTGEARITVDVEDSRANLFVVTRPVGCFPDAGAVQVCDYELAPGVGDKSITFFVEETLGSNGMPELQGSPR